MNCPGLVYSQCNELTALFHTVQMDSSQRYRFHSSLFMLTDTKRCLVDTHPTGNIAPSQSAP